MPTWTELASEGSDENVNGEEDEARARPRGRGERGGEARARAERATRRAQQQAALEFEAAERLRSTSGGVASVVATGDVGDLQELAADEYQEFLAKDVKHCATYIEARRHQKATCAGPFDQGPGDMRRVF